VFFLLSKQKGKKKGNPAPPFEPRRGLKEERKKKKKETITPTIFPMPQEGKKRKKEREEAGGSGQYKRKKKKKKRGNVRSRTSFFSSLRTANLEKTRKAPAVDAENETGGRRRRNFCNPPTAIEPRKRGQDRLNDAPRKARVHGEKKENGTSSTVPPRRGKRK